MACIRGYSTYIPRYRIERSTIAEEFDEGGASGETAVPAHDETVLSMGVSAAKRALDHADVTEVGSIYTASISEPYDERGLAGQIAAALGTFGDVRVGDFQSSARAGTNALLAGTDAVGSERGPALVVAADIVHAAGESEEVRTAGAGAGAVVLADEGDVASVVEATANTTGFLGSFTRAGESPVDGHARFNRRGYVEAVTGALGALEAEPAHLALPAPDEGWGHRARDNTDLNADLRSTFQGVGWAGAASTFLDLGRALEHATVDECITLASYGPGGSDALVFETGTGISKVPEITTADWLESKEYVTYAQNLDYRNRARGEN